MQISSLWNEYLLLCVAQKRSEIVAGRDPPVVPTPPSMPTLLKKADEEDLGSIKRNGLTLTSSWQRNSGIVSS